MSSANRYEQQFLDALKAIFVGAKVEGDSGYINLMRIKATYFEQGVFPQLMADIAAACKPFEPSFREELFDKLYDFFRRYFSESGSIYFRHTAASEGIYERVYTDDRDVMLFWKTHMLYYVKTDRLFTSMEATVDGERFFFDVSGMALKRANEKRELIYEFRRRDPDGRLVFAVTYSEKGRKTKTEEILAAIRKTGAPVDEETLERARRVFEKQAEVDYFINKDAKAFLEEQFDLWMYQYLFKGESAFTETRLRQLQAIKAIAYAIIGFIARFEDELVAVWNKPKFVLNSHYVVTLDKILDADAGLAGRLFAHAGMAAQAAEWRELGMLGDASAHTTGLSMTAPRDASAQTAGLSMTPPEAAPVILSGSTPDGALRRDTSEESIAVDRPFAGLSLQRTSRGQPAQGDIEESQRLWAAIQATDLTGAPLHPRYRFLPLDTAHFPDLEPDILALFPDHDAALDGWLVHSENYQALNTLLPKFRERVKAIYIDPPYNTGSTEFIYENLFQHSSWLSMMDNRLERGVSYLQPDGIMCITIDDYEFKRLSILLDAYLGIQQLGTVVIRSKPQGRATARGFSINHEYGVFAARSEIAEVGRLPRVGQKAERYADQDSIGVFTWTNFRGTGANSYRKDRPKLFYPIYVAGETIRVPNLTWNKSENKWEAVRPPDDDEEVLLPVDTDGRERVWSLGWDRAQKDLHELKVMRTPNGLQVYRKYRPNYEGMLPGTWWDSTLYSASESGTKLLQDLFGVQNDFSYPKSIYAVEDSLKASGLLSSQDGYVLDFFAGSGTTAHAVMNLNRADGGSRKYILVEMGEHFRTVILPRVKKVAFSDKWKDGKANGGQGMSHFVKYFDLEQYEDTLRRAAYGDHAAPLFATTLEDLARYVFLRDLKLLDAVSVGVEENQVAVALEKLYPGIDLAETLSCLTGKWIKRITAGTVEFADGSTADLAAPRWEDVKGLVWW